MEPSNSESKIHLEIENGIMLVGSDAHYWPGAASTAHRAFVKFAKDLKPKILIFNGDALDLPQISRHPPLGFSSMPTVEEELKACQERKREIEQATPRNSKLVFTIGNHDTRFETRLATVAKEFCRVHGFRLQDHFSPRWHHTYTAFVNDDVVVKHRYKGGLHAAFNNALWSGKTIITGHLHSQRVSAITDYGCTRWGVDTGCLACVDGPQFAYCENNPKNWQSGFGVFTFHNGKLLPPELVSVWSDERAEVAFRGKIIKV